MFDAIAALVDRRAWLVILGWSVVAGLLAVFAPSWASVSRDDDVRFFPPSYPSVVGQDLLERGFPDDVASAHVVVVSERRPGRFSTEDIREIDRMTDSLAKLREEQPALGIKHVTDHRTPVIGPRLLATLAD